MTELDTRVLERRPPSGRPYAEEVGAEVGRLRVRLCVENARPPRSIPNAPPPLARSPTPSPTWATTWSRRAAWPGAGSSSRVRDDLELPGDLSPVVDGPGSNRTTSRRSGRPGRPTPLPTSVLTPLCGRSRERSVAVPGPRGPGDFDVLVGRPCRSCPRWRARSWTVSKPADRRSMNAIPMACCTSVFNATSQPAISPRSTSRPTGCRRGAGRCRSPGVRTCAIRLASHLERAGRGRRCRAVSRRRPLALLLPGVLAEPARSRRERHRRHDHLGHRRADATAVPRAVRRHLGRPNHLGRCWSD